MAYPPEHPETLNRGVDDKLRAQGTRSWKQHPVADDVEPTVIGGVAFNDGFAVRRQGLLVSIEGPHEAKSTRGANRKVRSAIPAIAGELCIAR